MRLWEEGKEQLAELAGKGGEVRISRVLLRRSDGDCVSCNRICTYAYNNGVFVGREPRYMNVLL